jgi:uncharacterized protein
MFKQANMKQAKSKWVSSALVLATLFSITGFSATGSMAFADTSPDEKIISTQGYAAVEAKPDSFCFTVAVNTKSPQMTLARQNNNKSMNAIVKSLEALKVKTLEMETQGLSVHPVFEEYRKDHLTKIIGYEVTNTLKVSVKRLKSTELEDLGSQLIDNSLNAGASHVSQLNFFLDDVASAQAKSLELAVLDARHNADIMAHAAGIQIIGVSSISGQPQQRQYATAQFSPMVAKAMAGDQMTESTPVKTGTELIETTVYGRFRF